MGPDWRASARAIVNCQATLYTWNVILSFKHRGLKALYEGRRANRLNPEHVPRLRRVLAVLDQSTGWEGMDVPGFKLHKLTGRLAGYYAVAVSANWRVTFRFLEGHAHDVDYIDYH